MNNTKVFKSACLGVFLSFNSGWALAQEFNDLKTEVITATPTVENKVLPPPKSLSYECQTGEKKFDTKTIFYEVFKDPAHDPEEWGYAKESFNVLRSEIVIEGKVLPVSMKLFLGDTLLASGEEIGIGDELLKELRDEEATKKAKAIIAEAKKKNAIGDSYELPLKAELISGTCKTRIDVTLKSPKALVDKTDKDFAAIIEKEKKIAEEVKVCEKELASKSFKQNLMNVNYCVVEKCGRPGFGLEKYKKMLEGIRKSLKAEALSHGLSASCPIRISSMVSAQPALVSLLGPYVCSAGVTYDNKIPTDCASIALRAFSTRVLRSTVLKENDLLEMAQFAGKSIYEQRLELAKPKEKKPEELDPDELVKKMAQEERKEETIKEELPPSKNWVMVVL